MIKLNVGIIGAGIAGLASGYYTKKEFDLPISISIFEKSAQMGGRLKTVKFKGEYIDIGSQLISNGDFKTMQLLEELNLNSNLERFEKTFISTFHKGELTPVSFSSGIYHIYSKMEQQKIDKLKKELKILEKQYLEILSKPSDYTNLTFDEWCQEKIGETPKLINTILRAICFADSTKLSALYGLTTLYIYLEDCFFLPQGMDIIIRTIVNKIESSGIDIYLDSNINKIFVRNNKVENISIQEDEEKKQIVVDNLISAIPAPDLIKLLPDTKLSRLLAKIDYNPCIFVLISLKKDLWDGTWGVIFDEDESPISLVIQHSNKHIKFRKNKGIIGVLLPNDSNLLRKSDSDLYDLVLSSISQYFKLKGSDVLEYKVYRWEFGLPICSPEFHKLQEKIMENSIEGLFLCGDYIGLPSQDGATESAEAAAKSLRNKLNKN